MRTEGQEIVLSAGRESHPSDPQAPASRLWDVARARGGVAKLAQMTDLNREHLYRMLLEKGNPELRSLEAPCRTPWGSVSP